MQESMLDEVDRRLIHALQVEPRASWRDLAPVVGKDPVTLARHWTRLREKGIVWVTGLPTRLLTALIEIECSPEHLDANVRELEGDPAVWVLDHCSGSRDLLASVTVADLNALADYATLRLGALRGVRSLRVHPINEFLIDAANWRLRALTPNEAARIPPPHAPRARAARRVPDDLRAAIETEVWVDGRVPITTIAEKHCYTPQRVADALATLRRNGDLRFRTDVARELSDWPIYAWYFIEAPAHTIEVARSMLGSVPEVRLAVTAPSRYNLILAVWLRRFADINRFEIALGSALKECRIADRSVVIRIRKHMAHVLGPDTRSVGIAPAS